MLSSKEPEYMVVSEDHRMDPKEIRISFLREKTKQEFYKLHKDNPEMPVSKLAEKFGMSIQRAKAVILLMRKREDMMRAEGVLNPHDQWIEVYSKYTSDKVVNSVSALSAEYNLPEGEIQNIIDRMGRHEERMSSVERYENEMEAVLTSYDEVGVDTKFRESPVEDKTTDYTVLFGDDGLEEAMTTLKKRIEKETRANVLKILRGKSPLEPIFEKLDGEVISTDSRKGVTLSSDEVQNTLRLLARPDSAPEPSFCRWKFAFRDLTGEDSNLSRKQRKMAIAPPPTAVVMCTRNGRLRAPTLLEQSGRSWGRPATTLDLQFHSHSEELKAMIDFDKDEHLLRKKIDEKRARRAAIKASSASS